MKYQISVEAIQQVVSYLITRPYTEVASLIDLIKAGNAVEEPVVDGEGTEAPGTAAA